MKLFFAAIFLFFSTMIIFMIGVTYTGPGGFIGAALWLSFWCEEGGPFSDIDW